MTPASRHSPLRRASGSTSDIATTMAFTAGHVPRTVSRQRSSAALRVPRPSHPKRSTSLTVGCIKSTGTLNTKLPLLTRSIVRHCTLWQLAVVVDLRCCTCDIAGALTLSPPFPRRLVHAVDFPSHSPNVAVNFNSAPLLVHGHPGSPECTCRLAWITLKD